MGKLHDAIDDRLRSFLERQHVFFVATAPSGDAGRVNLSPKGLDTFRVIGPREIAYLDYVGSGAETIAHLRENGRITIMFCSFEGPPMIVRLYGRGEVVEPQDPDFARLRQSFPASPGDRSIIRVELERIADSCGYGVPVLRYESERGQLGEWAERKGEDGVLEYQRNNNVLSIDGLPALRWVREER